MGTQLLDQHSLLHFAVGIIMYFFSVPFWVWNLLHLIFELIENTETGVHIINQYIKIWPGGKEYADSPLNCFGDLISGALGWLLAYWLDSYGTRVGWFKRRKIPPTQF